MSCALLRALAFRGIRTNESTVQATSLIRKHVNVKPLDVRGAKLDCISDLRPSPDYGPDGMQGRIAHTAHRAASERRFKFLRPPGLLDQVQPPCPWALRFPVRVPAGRQTSPRRQVAVERNTPAAGHERLHNYPLLISTPRNIFGQGLGTRGFAIALDSLGLQSFRTNCSTRSADSSQLLLAP